MTRCPHRACNRDRRYSAVVLIYAGIDEAGYGPMLGPLCVASSVFVLDEHDPAGGPPDLWRLLRRYFVFWPAYYLYFQLYCFFQK